MPQQYLFNISIYQGNLADYQKLQDRFIDLTNNLALVITKVEEPGKPNNYYLENEFYFRESSLLAALKQISKENPTILYYVDIYDFDNLKNIWRYFYLNGRNQESKAVIRFASPVLALKKLSDV